jgi:two-component system cell cycle response regulator DivK
MVDEVVNSTQQSKNTSSQEITVLVVEDNVSNFVLIARMLGYMGIHCEWKTSYSRGICRHFAQSGFKLMDIRLPYEDGYGL